jgi:hypothetical protein
MQVSPVHDKGITIRIDDEEGGQQKEVQEEVPKEKDEWTEEETEEETEEDTEEEDTEEEDEGSDEETFGFRPQKKPAPVTQPKAPVAQPKKTFYWIAPFDD